MKQGTATAITAILNTDATITSEVRDYALDVLRKGIPQEAPRTGRPLMYRPRRAADLLGVSTRTLRYWASSGKLEPVVVGKRTTGYTVASVEALAKM